MTFLTKPCALAAGHCGALLTAKLASSPAHRSLTGGQPSREMTNVDDVYPKIIGDSEG